ncbi:MAG: acyl carrier protein, partial [Cyanobacteria bacterium P01_F01_bin.33]
AGEPHTLLLEHLRLQIAKVLGLPSPSQDDVREGFANLGMDSLMAVELRNRLQSSFNCSIPPTLAFDYPTVEDLADYFANEVLTSTSEPAVDTAPSHVPPAEAPIQATEPERIEISHAAIAELTDSEAEALLLSKLDSLRF